MWHSKCSTLIASSTVHCCVRGVCVCTVCGCMSHLADTFVVKETQSVTKDSGVVPVMSSHCAGDVPPVRDRGQKMSSLPLQLSQCFSFHNPHPFTDPALHPTSIDQLLTSKQARCARRYSIHGDFEILTLFHV